MTDQAPGPPGTPDADAPDRDIAVAEALAVPELAEPTRRRLVTAALEAADADAFDHGPSGRRVGRLAAVLGVAAALVVGAVVGTAIVSQPDDTTPTAARAPATTVADDAPAAASPDRAGATDGTEAEAPAAASAPLLDLGELGELVDADAVRAAIDQRLQDGDADASAPPATTPCSIDPGGAASYGLVLFTAAGTATRDGSSVSVLVGPTSDRKDVAVVLDPARGCELLETVTL